MIHVAVEASALGGLFYYTKSSVDSLRNEIEEIKKINRDLSRKIQNCKCTTPKNNHHRRDANESSKPMTATPVAKPSSVVIAERNVIDFMSGKLNDYSPYKIKKTTTEEPLNDDDDIINFVKVKKQRKK